MMRKDFKGIKLADAAIIAGLAFILIMQPSVLAADDAKPVPVNVDNFVIKQLFFCNFRFTPSG